MVLLQRIRAQAAGSAVADLFAADYIGALLGGLAFPFLLLPLLGQIRGALVVGMANALAGCGLVLGVFRAGLPAPARRAACAAGAAVIALLAGVFAVSERVEDTARQQLYDDPIVHAERSRYQEIVITESVGLRGHDVRLFLNGDLQFSSVDEYRYHEALVHPAMAGRHGRVLILGGGDGLAAREVLRYPDVRELVEVELDPAVIRLARTDPRLTALNRHAMADSRIRVVVADAFGWLRGSAGRFDVVIIDMPDPDAVSTAKLYSTEFYGMARRALAEHGRLVVQASSPYFAPRTFSCVVSTIRAAGLGATPYHVDVPTFGDWGFVLAQAGSPPPLELSPAAPELRSLDPPTLSVAGVFPKDRRPTTLLPSTLDKPLILRYSASDWGAS
jgi:spermidine synthase